MCEKERKSENVGQGQASSNLAACHKCMGLVAQAITSSCPEGLTLSPGLREQMNSNPHGDRERDYTPYAISGNR